MLLLLLLLILLHLLLLLPLHCLHCCQLARKEHARCAKQQPAHHADGHHRPNIEVSASLHLRDGRGDHPILSCCRRHTCWHCLPAAALPAATIVRRGGRWLGSRGWRGRYCCRGWGAGAGRGRRSGGGGGCPRHIHAEHRELGEVRDLCRHQLARRRTANRLPQSCGLVKPVHLGRLPFSQQCRREAECDAHGRLEHSAGRPEYSDPAQGCQGGLGRQRSGL
mmetsp:Transcript_64204/g.133936  ORF Transcript_64204/g.133936 Transcript_64204/m.133936 type:complete len:222 (-) Transcript_64204:12005-12670(-)